MKHKINKVKQESLTTSDDSISNPALNRKDHGLLMWDLKQKTKEPLNDLSMEFAINTVLRNRYKRIITYGFSEKYETLSLTNKTGAKVSSSTFDFALINFDEKTIDELDSLIKRAEPKSMIMIVNAPKNKGVKDLLSYLKYTGIRNEYQKVDLGIILIAK